MIRTLFFAGFVLISSQLWGQTVIDFNTSSDLTTYFNPSPGATIVNSTTGGLANSGAVDILSTTEVWTLKNSLVAGAGASYTVSAYVQIDGNSGRGGLGITTSNNNTTSTFGHPSTTLGIGFHGGGGEFVNNGTRTNLSWPPDLVQQNWYFMELSITNTGPNTFDLDFKIYNSDANGVLGTLKTNPTLTGITNTNLGSAGVVYPYFCHNGSRLSKLDDFFYISNQGVATGIDSITACNSYTWIDGNTYTADNDTSTFTIVGGAVGGVDSIVTLDLTIDLCLLDQTLTTSPDTICAGDTSTINMGGSEIGIEYTLRDDADSSAVGTPIVGTGNPMDFGTGTLNATTTYHMYAERSGIALDFDDIDDRVELSSMPSLSGDFTVMFWMKTTNRSGRVAAWGEASGVSRYTTFGTHLNKVSFYTGIGNASLTRVSGLTDANDGLWHHVAVTRNSTTNQITIYLDGVQDGQGTATAISTNLANATLGSGFLNGSFQGDLDGTLDDFSVWGAALTPAQIQNSMMTGVQASATNLRAYYDFESATGTTVVDRSGNGQTGTMVNMDPANDWVKGISVERKVLPARATVTVNTLPIVQANASMMTICNGDQVTLTGAGATTYTWDNSVVDGTAFTPSATTTYNVTGTDANNCENTANVQVTVNALPTVQANASMMALCAGDQVTLTGAGATTYTWDNSVVDGTAFTPSATTTYNVTGTDANNCENTANVQVTVNALPTVQANASMMALCAGDQVTLTGAGATTYTWDNSVVDGTAFTPSATTTYNVTGTDGNNCENTANVQVTVNALPTVQANASMMALCAGDQVTLTGAGATTYVWDNGVTNGVPVTLNTTTTYNVTGTDVNSCENTASIQITASTPLDTAVTVSSTSLNAVATGVSYQWINCGQNNAPIFGMTSQTFTPSTSGSYAVIVNDGTCSYTSGCISFVLSSIEEVNAQEVFAIYPNPNQGHFTVVFKNTPTSGNRIEIMNVTGQVVYNNNTLDRELSIELLDVAQGMYFVRINGQYTQKVIITE